MAYLDDPCPRGARSQSHPLHVIEAVLATARDAEPAGELVSDVYGAVGRGHPKVEVVHQSGSALVGHGRAFPVVPNQRDVDALASIDVEGVDEGMAWKQLARVVIQDGQVLPSRRRVETVLNVYLPPALSGIRDVESADVLGTVDQDGPD